MRNSISPRRSSPARLRCRARSTPAAAQEMQKINVSYQPSLYWALPYYIATKKGSGRRPGSTRPSRPSPQARRRSRPRRPAPGTSAAPARSPRRLGAARFGLVTIGITNDESKANVIMVKGDRYRRDHERSEAARGHEAADHDQLDRRLRRPQLPQEMGPDRHATCVSSISARRRSSPAMIGGAGEVVGVWAPEHLHARGEGRRQGAVHRRRRRRDRAGRARRAGRLRQRASGARRQISRGLSAGLGLGQGEPQGGRYADEGVLRRRRRRGLRQRDRAGVRATPDARLSTSNSRPWTVRAARPRSTAGSARSAPS